VPNSHGNSPIIIIGMHRSGTSMVTRMLESLGLFVGARKDDNHEALFFRRINEWLMSLSGATWDYPAASLDLLNDSQLCKVIGDYLKRFIKFPYTFDYLGFPELFRRRTLESLEGPWGWKDPRNTFTLQFWLDIFPSAKVINIHRHGMDVASSLMTRHRKCLSLIQSEAYKRRFFLRSLLRPSGRFTPVSVRCSTVEGAFSLWEEYMTQALNLTGRLNSDCLDIQYESFLEDPGKYLKELAVFCNLKCNDMLLHRLAEKIDSTRAWAYKSGPLAAKLIDERKDRLAMWGY